MLLLHQILIELNQLVASNAEIDAALIRESMLIRITLIEQFIFCLLQCIRQYIHQISLIIDRYDALWLIISKFTFKLIELTRIAIDGTGITFNSCQTIDIVAGNNDSLFFKIFSNYNVIAIESCSFVNTLMDCYLHMVLLYILIQFKDKMDSNSLLLIFNAIYSIASMINNTLSNTASETVVEIFFPTNFYFCKNTNKS